MFHDVVVPLDGSSLAECAIARAGWIASESGARLHLIRAHVRLEGDSIEQNAATRAGAAEYLREIASWLSDGSQIDVRVAVLDGTPALAIADYADRVDSDLIVMTTHGRTGVERRRLGSVASVVAHHVRCPVVLARAVATEYAPRQAPIEGILIAVDGTESPQEVEALALRLGSLGHPRFQILYTLSPALAPQLVHAGAGEDLAAEERDRQGRASAESYASRIARRLRAAGLRAEVLLSVTTEPTRAMLEAAEREEVDVVVVKP